MHSSPIDLLVRAPGQRKAEPSEPETDGRFSDLLRAEPEPATEPTEAASGAEPPEAVTPETAEAGAQPDPIPTGTADEAAKAAAVPTDAKAVVQPVAAVPEAITHVAPAAATGSTDAGTVTTNGGAAPAMTAAPAVPTPNPAGPGDVQQAAKPVAPTNPALPVAAAPQSGQPSPATPVEVAATPSPEGGAIPSTSPSSDPAVATATRMTAPVVEDAAKPANSPTIMETGQTPAAQAAATVTPAGTAPAVGAGVSTDSTNAATPDAITRRAAPVAAGAMPSPEVAGDPEPTDDAELPVLPVGKDRAAKPAGQTALATAQGAGLTSKAGDPSALSQVRAVAPTDAQSVDPLPPSGQPDPAGVSGAGQAARPAAESATIIAQTQSSAPPPPAADQVVLQLRRAVANGVDRLTVQLKPATLGRVDVQMEVGFDGRVQAVISVERPETLQLLQRDARTLTTALMDAGLQADSGSLSFNLRGQTGDQAGGNQRLPDGGPPAHDAATDDRQDATTNITLSLGSGRVDIKV